MDARAPSQFSSNTQLALLFLPKAPHQEACVLFGKQKRIVSNHGCKQCETLENTPTLYLQTIIIVGFFY